MTVLPLLIMPLLFIALNDVLKLLLNHYNNYSNKPNLMQKCLKPLYILFWIMQRMLEMLSFCLLLNFCHLCHCFADMGLVIDSSLWKLSCWTSSALPSLTALLPAREAQCRDLLSSVLPKLLELYLMCVDLIYCAFKQVSMCTTCSYCICLLDTRNWGTGLRDVG